MKASIQFKCSRDHKILQWVEEFSFKENVDISFILKKLNTLPKCLTKTQR